MKKILLLSCFSFLSLIQVKAQCTFESLFPLPWASGKFTISETFGANPIYQKANDTIRGSAFETGLDYFFTVRNMDLSVYAYKNVKPHPCFVMGDVVLNCVANDTGLIAYNYQVTFPASQRTEFYALLDSMKSMMSGKFTYNSTVKNTTKAIGPKGEVLTGEGACVYFNDQPIIPTNLTYAQFVIRGGFLGKKPNAPSDPKVMLNQAEDIQYYRLEIIYKRPQPKW